MKFSSLAFLCLIGSAPLNQAAETPNIIVILADDYGYGSAGCYGADGKLIQTPNIDRLAKEGRRFTDANTTSSVCSPTRYSVLTGRYCWRTSLDHEVLSTFAPLHIEKTRLNMASLLKKHGYQTASIGKWHLGYGTADDSPKWRTDYTAELSPGPLDIGFDYHFAVPSNHGDLTGVFVENRFVYGLRSGKIPAGMKIASPVPDSDDYQPHYTEDDLENGKGKKKAILELDAPRRKNERVMKVLSGKATGWIERQPKDKPFFLYFTPVAVHNPVTPDKDIAGKSAVGLYGDWISELDRSVGRILDILDKTDRAKDTLIIFSSDNGGVKVLSRTDMLQTKAYHAGLKVNGDLRGGKHTVWEGGFKVPFIVRWPGRAPAGSVCSEMVSLADILATTAAIVGEALPAASKDAEDSYNILPAILGQSTPPIRRDMIVHSADGVFAIRKGPWKWIEGVPVAEIKSGVRKSRADEFTPQLYNTRDDPAETKDLSAAHPDIVREMTSLLNLYRDGGFSREVPAGPMPQPEIAPLPPLTGTVVFEDTLSALPAKPWTLTGDWSARDDAVWGGQKKADEKPAALTRASQFTDGTLQYDLCFKGGSRHSLRIHVGEGKRSFRIVVSPSNIEIAKNLDPGESADKLVVLASKRIKLKEGDWSTLRLTFAGKEITAQIAGVTVKGTHDIIAESKRQLNFLVFEREISFRNLMVVR